MRILVIAGRFGISGVPLAQFKLARALARRKHRVDLIYGMINDGCVAPQNDNVRVMSLDRPRVSQLLFPLIRYFRTVRPEIVFSAGDHLNIIVLIAAILSRTKAKISCSSRVTPFDTYSKIIFKKGFFLKFISYLTTWRADVLTCVSEDMVKQYQSMFKKSRHVCVYNIIDDKESRERMDAIIDEEWLTPKNQPIIVAAGNLMPWKGFDDLITAMSRVIAIQPARLLILGEGKERQNLTKLIEKLELQKVVRLRGVVQNPLAYFKRADVFVLSSRVEGLPNVLVEAMLCGCTPVATDCPTGPREVLQDGKFGHIVPIRDPFALADALVAALNNPIPPPVLRSAIHRFSEEAVLARHFHLLGFSE
jgi:glycosyltransferase involved in cell wall biosynthesis